MKNTNDLIRDIFVHMESKVVDEKAQKVMGLFHKLPDIDKYRYFYSIGDIYDLLKDEVWSSTPEEIDDIIDNIENLIDNTAARDGS